MMSTTGRMPGHRRADAEAGDPGLGDRRVEDALRPELLDEPREHLERRARLGDVLADDEHGRSRRSSSASASFTACANVSVRVPGGASMR